jgi:hypothetical protein
MDWNDAAGVKAELVGDMQRGFLDEFQDFPQIRFRNADGTGDSRLRAVGRYPFF